MTNLVQHTWSSNMFKRYFYGLAAILATVVTLCASQPAVAQPKSVGASFSYTGLNFIYEHNLRDRNVYLEGSLKIETASTFFGTSNCPGISPSVILNNVVKSWQSSEGNTIRLVAGTGASLGINPERRDMGGVNFGLRGRVAVECVYIRKAEITFSVSPLLGFRLDRDYERYVMKFFSTGLLYSLIPEIGIKYRF